jgi:hypothetical protein
MRVWSHLILDAETARTLLRLLKERKGIEISDEQVLEQPAL